MTTFRSNLGKKIETLRKERGISTYKLIKNGVKTRHIYAIENGKHNYTIDTLFDYIQNIVGEDKIIELEVRIK